MGGNPVVQIDRNTGQISGTPQIIGEHVMAVCAEEYRDGVLLSVIRRDFQFVVSGCEKAVDAAIVSDRELNENEFELKLCGDFDVQFQNLSTRESDIQEYNTMAERLAQLEVLPPVEEQWRYLPAIANRYGVDLKVLNSRGGKSGMYKGPLEAWDAELSGPVGAVLVAALEIQKTVPTYLYQMHMGDGTARVGLSIIGSE